LRPTLCADFFTSGNTFTFNFLGSCTVVYHNETRKDTFGLKGFSPKGFSLEGFSPKGAEVLSYRITYNDGNVEEVKGSHIKGGAAHAVRDGKVRRIDVTLG